MTSDESLHAGVRQPDMDRRRGMAAIWFSLAAGPLAWVIGLNLEYSLVVVACARGSMFWLHLVSVATLLLAAAGVAAGLRAWRRAGGDVDAEARGEAPTLGQFLAALGVIGSAYFACAIVAQWVGSFMLNPCVGI